MLGKRVLFPHGFHGTGMPIKVSISDRKYGIELLTLS